MPKKSEDKARGNVPDTASKLSQREVDPKRRDRMKIPEGGPDIVGGSTLRPKRRRALAEL
ncbi:MAG: hypothetical protein HRU00_17200 [Myxococcales bacterium]|nr:hypothetical protein [Myxococcales bacterium]